MSPSPSSFPAFAHAKVGASGVWGAAIESCDGRRGVLRKDALRHVGEREIRRTQTTSAVVPSERGSEKISASTKLARMHFRHTA